MYDIVYDNGRTYEGAFTSFSDYVVTRVTKLYESDAKLTLRINKYLSFNPASEVFIYQDASKLNLQQSQATSTYATKTYHL